MKTWQKKYCHQHTSKFRQFKVPYFSIRSSRSNTHPHWQQFCNWFQIYLGAGIGVYILLINQEWGHYRDILDRGLDHGRGPRFPYNDRTDKVNKLHIKGPVEVVFTEQRRTWRYDRNHKTVSLTMRNFGPKPSLVQPAIQSCDTGQRIVFYDSGQLTITWMSTIKFCV